MPKRSIRSNGNIYQIFQPKNFTDVQYLYQDKTSKNITINEIKFSISAGWFKKYQPVTIDTTKDEYTGHYRLRPDSLFVPNSSPF